MGSVFWLCFLLKTGFWGVRWVCGITLRCTVWLSEAFLMIPFRDSMAIGLRIAMRASERLAQIMGYPEGGEVGRSAISHASRITSGLIPSDVEPVSQNSGASIGTRESAFSRTCLA